MARAKTKEELITSANLKFDMLLKMLESVPKEKLLAKFSFDITGLKEAHWSRDEYIKDVLTHLYEWHQLLLVFVKSNQNGIKKAFLLEGYNWKNYAKMNLEFFRKHQKTTYDDAYDMLVESHNAVIELAESFSDEELFSKGVFSYVGTTTLGSYFVSATASHYDFAFKKIKKHIK